MKPLIRTLAAASLFNLGLGVAGGVLAGPGPDARGVAVEGVADANLRGLIQDAIGEERTAPRDARDARRRANAAAEAASALLRSEGYYEGVAEAGIASGASPRPVVHVLPGPRFHLANAGIEWVGDPPDAAAKAAARAALNLPTGAPGRASDVVGAEGRVVASLQKLGYADAAIETRKVVVDHADRSVRPTLRMAAGAPVRLGGVRVRSRERTRARWVARLAPWKAGAPYAPSQLAKLQKRLIDTGAYQSATVSLAPPTPSGAEEPRAVEVTLVDRPPHSLELGAGYSTTEGSGADAKYTLWNRLGRADALVITARLYDIQQKLDVERDLPDALAPDVMLKVGGGFLGDRTPAYDDLGGGVRLSVVDQFDKTNSVTAGAAFDYASTREKDEVNLLATPVGESLNLYITTLKGAFTLDRSNNIFNPTRGFRLEAEADPTWVAGDRELVYLKTQAQLSGYVPLASGWPVLAARVKLGSIFGGSIPDVPADRRFFAGGGGSVRGYGYQAVGPHLSDGTPEGGLSLTEGSIELRQSLPRHWGFVVFADAGAVGSRSAPGFQDLAVGVGAGVRYDLGFGPLRLDLGTPVNPRPGVSRIQVYISIGQAF